MSNYLAVATVTATLSRVLQAAVGADVPGATVTTARPDTASNGTPAAAVNLYLFQISPNAAWRNADVPTRRPDGSLVQRPQVALDLHYLLTFLGDETQLEPQRLLGSAVRTLHARPLLTRQAIRDTIADPTFGFLAPSDLGEDVELVKCSPLPLNLEELSKLWSVFFQTPYALSVAYLATVVLIESEESPQSALPVRQPLVYVETFRQPAIEEVAPATGSGQPIVAGSTLVIRGRRLAAIPTQVRIGGVTATPATTDVRDTEISLPLPAGLRAGVLGVQVIHLRMMGLPPEEHRGVESNVAAFVLRPTVTATVGNVVGTGNSPRSADVNLIFTPPVGRTQRVMLLLNAVQPPAGVPARAYSFPAPARSPSDPEQTATLTIPVAGVAAGTYVLRVQVDGAESVLTPDGAGVYATPQVTI
jgi:hypothetical protein